MMTPAEILRARGKLGPYTRPSAVSLPKDSDPAKVRAWCAEMGIDVGQRGRIPSDILEKFRQAQEETSA